ncbi:MAG: hypothetical protein JSS66_14640 [Armatimonadetes bacterium]|nr:hypothetical protein [Armatimonadota bacterium]
MEKRGSRSYYYRKVRAGKSIRSIYMGSGLTAVCLALADFEAAEKRSESRRAARDLAKRAEEALRSVSLEAEAEYRSFMLATGHHQHKRQWRKKRSSQRGGQ